VSDFVSIGIAIVALGSAAIGGTRTMLERRRARRELEARPVLTAGVAEGEIVRVTGVVRVLDETLEAPLSGQVCVVVRSRVTAGGNLARRAIVPRESFRMVAFVLDRPEGPVSIEGEHALLDLPPLKLPAPRGLNSDERIRRERFLALHGLKPRTGGRALFSETIVEPGARITVAGLVMKDPVPPSTQEELGFRDAAAPALRLAGNRDHPLVIGVPLHDSVPP
jgi:hypothetical protein